MRLSERLDCNESKRTYKEDEEKFMTFLLILKKI